jgi:hypothetical protein
MANVHDAFLPSGLRGRVRALKAREADILGDVQAIRRGTAVDQVLKGCWLETLEPGPYTFGGAPEWAEVLTGDRFVALLCVRMATYGAPYDFKVQCAKPRCAEPFEWSIDLEKDITIKAYPPAVLEALMRDNRFESALPDGRRVWFRLLRGKDEQKAQAQAGRTLSGALATRIVEIEGVHANDKRRVIEDLDLADARELQEKLDAVDGGIETALEVRCPHCHMVQEVELPLDGLFGPAKRPKLPAS